MIGESVGTVTYAPLPNILPRVGEHLFIWEEGTTERLVPLTHQPVFLPRQVESLLVHQLRHFLREPSLQTVSVGRNTARQSLARGRVDPGPVSHLVSPEVEHLQRLGDFVHLLHFTHHVTHESVSINEEHTFKMEKLILVQLRPTCLRIVDE